MMKHFVCLAALPALVGMGAARPVLAQSKEVVKFKVSTKQDHGRTLLNVELTIEPGYHINSNPASDSYLIPLQVKANPVAGLVISKPKYPAGIKKQFDFSDKPIAVYAGRLTVTVPVALAKGAKPGPRIVQGTVRYQACRETNCLMPVTVPFKVILPATGTRTVGIRADGKKVRR